MHFRSFWSNVKVWQPVERPDGINVNYLSCSYTQHDQEQCVLKNFF